MGWLAGPVVYAPAAPVLGQPCAPILIWTGAASLASFWVTSYDGGGFSATRIHRQNYAVTGDTFALSGSEETWDMPDIYTQESPYMTGAELADDGSVVLRWSWGGGT